MTKCKEILNYDTHHNIYDIIESTYEWIINNK